MYYWNIETKPSQEYDVNWIFAKNLEDNSKGTFEDQIHQSGKWMIFIPFEKVDDLWEKIRDATIDGRLGEISKVSTAKSGDGFKIICVQTYDVNDRDDIDRVRDELYKLGVTQKIPYKMNSIGESVPISLVRQRNIFVTVK